MSSVVGLSAEQFTPDPDPSMQCPPQWRPTIDTYCFEDAGKMACLMSLVTGVHSVGERMVICSSSTQCLDLVQSLCKKLDICTVRIDGATEASKRQEIVNAFNTYNVGKVPTRQLALHKLHHRKCLTVALMACAFASQVTELLAIQANNWLLAGLTCCGSEPDSLGQAKRAVLAVTWSAAGHLRATG